MSLQFDHIFWDWHGVLGTKGFWYQSAKEDPAIHALVTFIFNDVERVRSWMRNDITIHELIIDSGSAVTYEQLEQAFRRDWGEVTAMNMPLLSSIKALYPAVPHSIITDNMDVFATYVTQNDFIRKTFENVFNSSEVGALKSDTEGLFEHALQATQRSSFAGALLLDDTPANCERFESLGGRAILIKGNSL